MFFWITFIAYFGWQVLIGYTVSWYQLIHFTALVLPIELIPNYFKGQFTVSELFIFASMNAQCVSFCIDSVIYRHLRTNISGCNITNTVIFAPWVVLNFAGLSACAVDYVFKLFGVGYNAASKKIVFIASLLMGLVAAFILLQPYSQVDVIL